MMMIEEDIEHPNFNLTGALEKDNEIRFAKKQQENNSTSWKKKRQEIKEVFVLAI